ncbi:MAG: S41 family peptidase [Firmicutes bacterium]|nr:S41 family peptidase [Bacillota bacterium]
MKTKKQIGLLLVLITMLLIPSIFSTPALAAEPDIEAVRTILKQHYVTELSDAQLRGNSVDEILRKLDDPYTTLFTEADFTDYLDFIDGTYQGIGVVIEEKEGYIEIVSVFDGSPAQRAGLQSKDVLTVVNNTDLARMSQEQVVNLLRGGPGTIVSLTVSRDNQTLQFTVTREIISLPVVSSEMLTNHILYLRINSFASNTADLVQQELARHPDTAGIILDLRNNGGGYVQAAVALGQEFLDQGPIMWLQNRAGTQPINLDGTATYRQPLVLLVNQGSASASEIIAGAFQDQQRAVLVGETTFGKFCVQSLADLGDGYVLKYTTDYFLTPTQRLLNKIGVNPDIAADDKKALAIAERSVYDQLLMNADYHYLLTVDLDDMTAYFNAKKQFDGKSVIKDDRLFLNLRDVAREIGLPIWWDEKTHRVMVKKGPQPAELIIDDNQAFIDEGRTYVSVHKLAQIMSGYADYRAESNLVLLQWN